MIPRPLHPSTLERVPLWEMWQILPTLITLIVVIGLIIYWSTQDHLHSSRERTIAGLTHDPREYVDLNILLSYIQTSSASLEGTRERNTKLKLEGWMETDGMWLRQDIAAREFEVDEVLSVRRRRVGVIYVWLPFNGPELERLIAKSQRQQAFRLAS
jgi:hypothetical protein